MHARRLQEADLVRLKREAKAKNGFYCPPEAKLLFVIRIRGLNKVAPKVRGVRAAGVRVGRPWPQLACFIVRC